MINDMPSKEEQENAEYYVLKKQLVRPNTNLKKVMLKILFFLILNLMSSILLYEFLSWLGFINSFSEKLPDFWYKYSFASIILLMIILSIISFLIYVKRAIIGMIKLYQHYAAEDVRRRCLFKPTCSEYTIMAIEKYGVFLGLYKGYDRLFKRCKGNIYRIDYP